MSAKWVRVRKWDDQHLKGPLLPVKWLLRAFSSITLAVILLVLVAMYGTLASVPVGLIARLPTLLIYAATFVLTLVVLAYLPTLAVSRGLRSLGRPRAALVVWVVMGLGMATAAGFAWAWYLWPLMRWDPATGKGLMLFSWFVEHYRAVQFRRLPGIEMSELEFYAWWPLSLILLLFVLNLVTATVRRIEFIFPKVGVLTVHTGIVTIALGSVIYAGAKQEGDVILLAGGLGPDGAPRPGPAQNGFFDNTDAALWISTSEGVTWDQRPLGKLPRYYDYNLRAVGGIGGSGGGLTGPRDRDTPDWLRDFGPLDIRVPPPDPVADPDADPHRAQLNADVEFRVVGYASYCELEQAWVPAGESGTGAQGRLPGARSLRDIEVWLTRPDPEGNSPHPVDKPQRVFRFVPEEVASRLEVLEGVLGVEYTRGMSDGRWRDLQEPLPIGVQHALVVEIPARGTNGQAYRAVYPAVEGAEISVGQTGYRLQVKQISAQPPFPIITQGYRGASSSMAIVRVVPPAGADGVTPPAFDRWVYHRFPEIAQEMVDASGEPGAGGGGGMPRRRDPDPAISIRYIDASMVQVYFDESPESGSVRALVRVPSTGGSVKVLPNLGKGDDVPIAPALKMRLGERTDNAIRVEVPSVVPEDARNKNQVGNHQAAAIALEVREAKNPAAPARILWLPVTQYLGVENEGVRRVPLSDGRVFDVAFGRVRHALPLRIALKDFQMYPYPNTDTPRDYRSDLVVTTGFGAGNAGVVRDELRKTSLNEPLLVRVPYQPRADVPAPINWLGRLFSVIIPVQYKFSQAGWDAAGWKQTQAAADRGEAPRATARYTILGVGNNPGIYIIATGAVMMSVGIPWAFYLKPILMRRRKRKLQLLLASQGRLPAHLMQELGLAPDGPRATRAVSTAGSRDPNGRGQPDV